MRKIALIMCLLVSAPIVIGQSAQKIYTKKSDCAAVTQRMIDQGYSYNKQLEIQASPEKLASLDYMYAKSYEFEPGQMVLRSQRELINIDQYKHLRHSTYRVKVYDEATQLTIVLYSWNEVEHELSKIKVSHELASCN